MYIDKYSGLEIMALIFCYIQLFMYRKQKYRGLLRESLNNWDKSFYCSLCKISLF